MSAALIILGVVIALVLWLAWELWHAPLYDDEGFTWPDEPPEKR